jgi:hypothetical protein
MVWIFKTSVTTKNEVQQLTLLLDSLVHPEGRWTFDLEDCDKVLRIECSNLSMTKLIDDMNRKGFLCEELLD